jgi:hypothetical protein
MLKAISGMILATLFIGIGFYAKDLTTCQAPNIQIASNEGSDAFNNMVKAMNLPVKKKN